MSPTPKRTPPTHPPKAPTSNPPKPGVGKAAVKAYGTPNLALPAPLPAPHVTGESEAAEPFDRNDREKLVRDYVSLVKFVAIASPTAYLPMSSWTT